MFNSATNNLAYSYLEKYDYLIVPTAMAITGYSVCGVYCALGGFAAGATDESLYHYGYTTQRHLSAISLGAGILVVTNKDAISKSLTIKTAGIGAMLGLGLSSGVIQNHPILLQSLENTLLGWQTIGPYGSGAGIACSLIDEALYRYNITTYTHCSSGLKGVAFATFALPKIANIFITSSAKLASLKPHATKIPMLTWQIMAGAYTAYNSNTIQEDKLPIFQMAKDLHNTYSSVLNKTEIDQIIERLVIINIALNLIIQKTVINFYDTIQSLRQSTEELKNLVQNLQTIALSEFSQHFKTYMSLIPTYVLSQGIQSYISQYYMFLLNAKIEDIVYQELFHEEILLKLQQNNEFLNPEALIDRVSKDISTIVYKGMETLTSASSTYTKAIITATLIINNNAFDIIVCAATYSSFTESITKTLATKISLTYEQISDKSSLLMKIQKEILRQSKDITLTDGMDFALEKLQNITHEIREIQSTQNSLNAINFLWQNTKGWTDAVITVYLTFIKLINKELPFEVRLKVLYGIDDVIGMISWYGNNAAEINAVGQSVKKFNELLELIRNDTHNPNNTLIYEHNNHTETLTLSDIILRHDQEIFVSIDHLQFSPGTIYAITGKSGCGKTSLLIKIKGIEHDNIIASGKISYPNNDNTIFITQNDYIPLESTLYEVIMYPKTPSQAELERKIYLDKIINLMCLLEIDDYATTYQTDIGLIGRINEKSDWSITLSGGQKKKISLIRAIIQNPDILIMDELFAGMDPKSIKSAQHTLTMHLPQAMILAVDHDAKSHNFETNSVGFYNIRIDFSNGTIQIMEIEPIPNDHEFLQNTCHSSSIETYQLSEALGQCFANQSFEMNFCPVN